MELSRPVGRWRETKEGDARFKIYAIQFFSSCYWTPTGLHSAAGDVVFWTEIGSAAEHILSCSSLTRNAIARCLFLLLFHSPALATAISRWRSSSISIIGHAFHLCAAELPEDWRAVQKVKHGPTMPNWIRQLPRFVGRGFRVQWLVFWNYFQPQQQRLRMRRGRMGGEVKTWRRRWTRNLQYFSLGSTSFWTFHFSLGAQG